MATPAVPASLGATLGLQVPRHGCPKVGFVRRRDLHGFRGKKKRPLRGRFRCRAPAGTGAGIVDGSRGYSGFATSRAVSFSRIRADFPERPRK
jgi:hypothetical protein